MKNIGGFELKFVKKIDFNPHLQRMSVVIEDQSKFYSYVKGSPEKIKQLCSQNTIPHDFEEVLSNYGKVNIFPQHIFGIERV